LPNEGTVEVLRYKQFTFAEDAASPLNNASQNCTATPVVSASGELVTNAGFCMSTDADGDIAWFWWRQEESGTENCPTACGSWGYYNGIGKFEGITGGSTWKSVSDYPDGSGTGVWNGTYELK